jgi:lysine-specific demethylase 8
MNGRRIDVLEYRDFHRFRSTYYLANKPVVIRGVRESNPLNIFRWSAGYFEHVMGDTVVPVLSTTTGFLSYERDVSPMPFREFVKRSFGPDATQAVRYYFKNPTTMLPAGHDDSLQIAGLDAYIRRAITGNLWISGSGLTVGLHFDAAENFNFQLRGHKGFSLYPPGTRPYYPLPMFSQTAHISGVYRTGPNPDLRMFPRFDPSRALDVDMHEGDVLYLPAYWWHQVRSHAAENVNLNFWWLPSIAKQMANWNQALRGHVQLGLRLLKHGSIQSAPTETKHVT